QPPHLYPFPYTTLFRSRTLRFDRGRLVLADFGLAQLFWLPGGQPVAQRNARYSAPELFDGNPGRSDQFSLAILYHEMLTGAHPRSEEHTSELQSPYDLV